MSNSSLILVNEPGQVFETSDFAQHWTAGCARKGLSVHNGPRVNQALVEFSFILPPLSADHPGCYPIFTLARGVPAKTGNAQGTGGVFLHLTYEPSQGLIHCGMNAGTRKRKLQSISLGPAPPEKYTGRVLRAFILVVPGGLYPSIEDPSAEEAELFGELQLPRAGRAAGLPPWGVAPTGGWWITSGCEIKKGQGVKSFPPGFGLSDVRIHLLDHSSDADDFGMLPYSGELDHLIADPYALGDWDGGAIEEPLCKLLKGLADELADVAGDAAKWAGHVLDLAEETEELALRLPEDVEK